MTGEWRRHSVSTLIERGALIVGDGYRAKNDELASSGLPFARAGNINNGFQFDDADHFPECSLPRVGNKVSQPGDVVFTASSRDIFGCSKNRQNRIVENSTYPLDDFGFR